MSIKRSYPVDECSIEDRVFDEVLVGFRVVTAYVQWTMCQHCRHRTTWLEARKIQFFDGLDAREKGDEGTVTQREGGAIGTIRYVD